MVNLWKADLEYCKLCIRWSAIAGLVGLNIAFRICAIQVHGFFVQYHTRPSVPASRPSVRHCRAAWINKVRSRTSAAVSASLRRQLLCSLPTFKVIARHFQVVRFPCRFTLSLVFPTAFLRYISSSMRRDRRMLNVLEFKWRSITVAGPSSQAKALPQ